jgi:hypothetical protein
MISQTNSLPTTPMGATLVSGGATFRAWAPRATAVYVNGIFGGQAKTGQTGDLLTAISIIFGLTALVRAGTNAIPMQVKWLRTLRSRPAAA